MINPNLPPGCGPGSDAGTGCLLEMFRAGFLAEVWRQFVDGLITWFSRVGPRTMRDLAPPEAPELNTRGRPRGKPRPRLLPTLPL